MVSPQRLQASSCSNTSAANLSVAVIGAGAAGLVAARELRREGHTVTVFEQGDQIGGIWVYTADIEDDLLGRRSSRKRVHGSLYESLRTNLPRHIMAFTDFPFDFKSPGSRDSRLYCGHEEVLTYLQEFAQHFSLKEHICFNTAVVEATPMSEGRSLPSLSTSELTAAPGFLEELDFCKWRLRTKSRESGEESQAVFDALLVCNGHYSEPRLPDIPGSDVFPGRQMHSHNFRQGEDFKDQTVVVFGASASGQDIAREIAEVATKVYFSARPMTFGSKQMEWESSEEAFGRRSNMFRRAALSSLEANGLVHFDDGWTAEHVDTVVFATGYKYIFPFLEQSGVVSVRDNRVGPLYQHVISTRQPSLSFVGLPWQVIPFPMMELQSRWLAGTLSGRCPLPSRGAMEAHTAAFALRRKQEGVPERYFHRMGEGQWEYNAWLAAAGGGPVLEGWRPQLHAAGQANIRRCPDSYRDSWDDADLLHEAQNAAQAFRIGLRSLHPLNVPAA